MEERKLKGRHIGIDFWVDYKQEIEIARRKRELEIRKKTLADNLELIAPTKEETE